MEAGSISACNLIEVMAKFIKWGNDLSYRKRDKNKPADDYACKGQGKLILS